MKRKLFKITFLIMLFFIFLITGIFLYARIKPKLDIKNVNSFYLYDMNNELYFQGSGNKEWVNLDEISPFIINATI